LKSVSHTGIVPMNTIKVLIVEDDPMVAHINKKYTETVKGFTVIGVAKTGKDALNFLEQNTVDLIVLDLYLPQISGLEALDALRREGQEVDVIVITAADDSKTVAKVLRYGVIAYIEKPFQFERYQSVLEAYRDFFQKTNQKQRLNQEDIDCLSVVRKEAVSEEMPKNFSSSTLGTLVRYLVSQNQFLSAQEVALGVDISRGTVRRYLEYLVEQGLASKIMDYKSVGRPVHRFKILDSSFRQDLLELKDN
jgi:two-component system response regulator DctR